MFVSSGGTPVAGLVGSQKGSAAGVAYEVEYSRAVQPIRLTARNAFYALWGSGSCASF